MDEIFEGPTPKLRAGTLSLHPVAVEGERILSVICR